MNFIKKLVTQIKWHQVIKRIILITLIHILVALLHLSWIPEKFQNAEPMLNIYNQPLVACGDSSMSSGSWDTEGKCSELDGGVHQICIRNIADKTPNFSSQTGQSDWSNQRGKDNHCVCLGAWSLYQAQKNKSSSPDSNNKVLKCDAIPKVALSQDYVSKFSEGWNKWNGLELKDQIKNGVEALVDNCYPVAEPQKAEELKKNYCKFAEKVPVLQDGKSYSKLCNS